MTARNISLLGATYSNVPGVTLPVSGGGSATFYEVSDTTAAAADVATGKYFYTASGVKTQGTNSGGGGSSVQIGYADVIDIPSATSSISFTGLSGEPTSFLVYYGADLSTPSGTPYKVACLVYDGTDIHGQTITNTSNAQVTYDGSSFSKSYNNGTLTLSSSGAYFQAGDYNIIYSYNGTAGNIKTADVQVGSGATSITFTDLEDEPIAWYCIFKSNFSTSNGYQRVIFVTDNDGSVGMAMDSSAHNRASWTSSYNNGSFTITSSGTNDGGYFHQPGYYQLTYVIDASGNYQTKTKTYTPTTSQQTETITADNGYDALKKVDVTVNAMPTMTLPSATSVTSSGTSKATITPSSSVQYLNIPTGFNGTEQYYTISASGGGEGKNVQVVQGTTRTTSSTLTAIGAEMTVSKTGTYDVYWSAFRSSTSSSYTYGTQLYVGGTAYGTQNTTWSNHVQNNHLTNVSLTANQKLRVYGRNSRGSSYYIYAPTLVIIEV